MILVFTLVVVSSMASLRNDSFLVAEGFCLRYQGGEVEKFVDVFIFCTCLHDHNRLCK